MLTNIANCCHPVPGDKIIGYITRNKGVTIHRQDCYNVLKEEDKERLVKVEWGQPDSLYPITVQLEAWDRVGLVFWRHLAAVESKQLVQPKSETAGCFSRQRFCHSSCLSKPAVDGSTHWVDRAGGFAGCQHYYCRYSLHTVRGAKNHGQRI